MDTPPNFKAFLESYWDTRPDDSVKDRIRLLRSSKKTRLVMRRTKRKKGEPVPSKDEHDEAQEADSLELDNLQDVLKDRREEKKRLQRVNKGVKGTRRRVWKRVKKSIKP